MPSPPISVFLTTIASQPALRQRQEYVLRILQVKKIPFTAYDLASDEDAKRLWKRKAPADKQQLPGILVGEKVPGTFTDFEEAVECGTLSDFLCLNEVYKPFAFEGDSDTESKSKPKSNEQSSSTSTPAKPLLPAKPIGVPGAMMPLQMTPEHLKKKILAQPPQFKNKLSGLSGVEKKPTPVNKRTGELELGDELTGFGLQGVKVTEDELFDLVKSLGLDDDAAGDLAKGLGGEEPTEEKDTKAAEKTKEEQKEEKEEEKAEKEEQKAEKKEQIAENEEHKEEKTEITT